MKNKRKDPLVERIQQKERYDWEFILDRDDFTGNLEMTVQGEAPELKINILPPRKFQGHTIYHLAGIGDRIWSDIRHLAFNNSLDCDRALSCNYPKSAQFCYTKNYKSCPGYKK